MSEPVRAARDYAQTSLRDLTSYYLDLLDTDVRARLSGRSSPVEHAVDRLAVSEAISRYVRTGRQVDVLSALNAGANWQSISDVLDAPVEQLRGDFRLWVEGQRALYDAMQQERPGSPPIGMSPAHGVAALRLAQLGDRESRSPAASDSGSQGGTWAEWPNGARRASGTCLLDGRPVRGRCDRSCRVEDAWCWTKKRRFSR